MQAELTSYSRGRYSGQFPQDFIPSGEFLAGTRVDVVSPSEIPRFRAVLLTGISGMPYSSEEERRNDVNKRTTEYFESAFARPEEWTFLAAKDVNGTIIGALEAKITQAGGERVGFVHWICVDSNHRQQGIAADLYREYEQRMKDLGDVAHIMAYVHNANLPSLTLHKKLGISQVFAEREDGKGKWYYKTL